MTQRGQDATGPPGRRPAREWRNLGDVLGFLRSTWPAEELSRLAGARGDPELRREFAARVAHLLAREGVSLPGYSPAELVRAVVEEAAGYGPIDRLLQDPDVTDILINGPQRVFVERGGQLQETGLAFRDVEHLFEWIQRMVAATGRRVDRSSPCADARLGDGSRLHVVLPPVAVGGPYVTLRKFPQRFVRGEDLLARGTLDEQLLGFLRDCVRSRLNIVVSGGTGSGKTTVLNVLLGMVSEREERIVTIEDAAELHVPHPHVVSLEARPANLEGQGEISIRYLVRNALRMRPDRIVVGEVRGPEALDMLQAMNTGHLGSMTTLHANSPRDALTRLADMAMLASEGLTYAAAQAHVASAVDVIVHQVRLPDGRRRIVEICCVDGLKDGQWSLVPAFLWREDEGGEAGGGRENFQAVPFTWPDGRRERLRGSPAARWGGDAGRRPGRAPAPRSRIAAGREAGA